MCWWDIVIVKLPSDLLHITCIYIKLICLWSFNISYLKKVKILSLFFSYLVCIHLGYMRMTDISFIDQASLFHLILISLSFTFISFIPISFIWTVWVSLAYHILVFVIVFCFHGANINAKGTRGNTSWWNIAVVRYTCLFVIVPSLGYIL